MKILTGEIKGETQTEVTRSIISKLNCSTPVKTTRWLSKVNYSTPVHAEGKEVDDLSRTLGTPQAEE